MARFLQIVGLAAGLIGLVLQFLITIPAAMAAGRGFVGAIVFYFSFFTILTNIAVVLVHVSLLTPTGYAWAPGFASPRLRAGVAVAICVVTIVYAVVLAPLWQPHGLFLLCNVLLHYVAPALFVLWWLTAGAEGTSRWEDIPVWLIYPVLYVVYALTRAHFTGEAPYPFLDVRMTGIFGVVLGTLGVAALFVALGVAAAFLDRTIGRRRAPAPRRR
ncbi:MULTISPECIES: Pr6Pr family membrane protein [Phyllobacteriaceae]|jgi:hypothetical protein|uniref:Pr6Pr family membrane protein n=1 Tax=Mesorhizobium hungaricum TaxID=1566387 RepID=A0A1C2DID6_9HYPH|nr:MULTISPECIES: Pr6Pr family membrane protein [Mesorhizobium]MBN9234366.1 Pr6Pr family membrane protein [Mesorhizobium sp.]MDQ0332431.1 hypothetical protein [Mesorhizobium sp. YL-MeA3-2017]OCX14539.1 hypothetical protein QV13_18965 [Mesorhizobium hungaricum]